MYVIKEEDDPAQKSDGHFRQHLVADCKSKAFSRIKKEKLPPEIITNIYLLRELDHKPEG